MSAGAITALNLTKTYPLPTAGRLEVLDSVTLDAPVGTFNSIIGPSGCGKSTLFQLLAGLERPDSGQVTLDGADITGQTGKVAFMPQRDLLLPWRSLLDNAVLGLDVQGVRRAASHLRARQYLERFGLLGFEEALPATLSGGMRQRVALLRTALLDKPVWLLDEPFGALDALTRTDLQEWLLGVWGQLGVTVLFITHDIEEAIFLSDHVHVLGGRPGRVVLSLPTPLPRPRRYEVVTTPAFAALKAELLAALRSVSAGANR